MNTAAPLALEALPPGDPLETVLEHVRRVVRADSAVLLSVDDARTTIERTAQWFSSPALREVIDPVIGARYDRERPGLIEVALERGRPLLLPRLEDWEAHDNLRARVEEVRGDEGWELLRGVSLIACPVCNALGRKIGALVVATANSRRRLTRSDLDMVVVLADLAALARERSDLLRAEARRSREDLQLKRAAESASSSLELAEVERQVLDHALRIAGADRGRLSRLTVGSERLVTAAETSDGERVEDDWSTSTIAEVARTRAPIVLGGPRPSLHVPVRLGPRLFGVLSLSRPEREFDRDDVTLLTRLAHSSAAAIANAIDFQHERHLTGALTRGFVPESLPKVPGWEIGLLYEPTQNQPTGGDVYGAWPLPGGEVALLIGDVAGKGLETAALSAMARFFIEARSWDSSDPAEVLEQANALLQARLPHETFVTAFLGFLGSRGIRYANAGHIAPMVLRPGGEILEVRGGGLPLGIDERPGYEQHEAALGSGDLLFALTDGIVEARRGGELLGDERLTAIVKRIGARRNTPQELARMVHDDVRDWADGLRDDASIVVLRRRMSSVVVGP